MLTFAVLSAALLNVVTATSYKEPPPTLDPKPYTVWDRVTIGGSKVGSINVPFTADDGSSDEVFMKRVDLVGSSSERGYAHGYLLAKDIMEFTGPKLDKYFMDEVLNIDISSLPDPLQKIFRVIQVKGAIAAPEVFREAMAWTWEQEKSYVPQYLVDEMEGIGRGVCASPFAKSDCNATEWGLQVKQLNMLPELIRMACTAYGAWGPATGGKGLTQLRALDFGGGPFANYTVVQVHRGDTETAPFVSIAFPAFVGAITGISSSGVGISEKVWMTYDKPSLQPGSYDGEADVFVLRDILQNSVNRAAAEAYIKSAKRTWGMWVGIGDYETQVFDLVGYTQADATVYTDVTAPSMTGQPYLENVAYVDKHPQPSGDGATGSLPTGLTDFYGNISCETNKIIVQNHGTGDLHIASYDYTEKVMYVSIGRINRNGEYGPEGGDTSSWKAYNRPHLKFSLPDLWAGN